MAYIGRTTDGFGVRQRFLFTPDAGATSVSGTDANGATLTFSDSVYMDVFLNGVLLKAGTDYNTNTANTIAGLTATVANDEVTVLVYDIFTTADMVSATSGGTFSGNVTHSGTVTVDDTTDSSSTTTGSIQTDGGVGIAKKLYVGTDLDVDGTANLDVVDIDGAVDMASTLAVSGATTAAAITASGIIKTDDTTDATSTTDGSLQTDGGLSVAKDAVIGDDLTLKSDSSVLAFGADADVKLTHVADTGLILAAGGQTTSDFGTPESGMKDFVIGGDGNVGMSILTTANNNARLAFGDVDDPDGCQLNYDNNTFTLDFQTGGSSTFRMGAGGNTGTSAGACILESRRNVTLADDASYSLTLKIGISVLSSTSNGEGALFHHYYSGQPSRVSDPNAFCDSSDQDGRLCLFKSTTASHNYTVKNRRGAQYSINLMSFSTSIT